LRNQLSGLWSRFKKPQPNLVESTLVGNAVPAVSETENQIPVLLALARQSDIDAMRAMFQDTPYVAVPANGIDHACKVAGHIMFPVVVYDPFLDPAERQTGFRRMVGAWRAPSMVLVCDSDARSDEASQRMGAFSIVCRPLERKTLISVLHSAYLHWKSQPSAAEPFSPSVPVTSACRRSSTR